MISIFLGLLYIQVDHLLGWIHHTVRSALATFLTRGDLWISWEYGFRHFMNYLVDGDWCVGAGNWMWMSNAAFDRIENETPIIDPVLFGKRLEPSGDYIRRYVPELAKFEEFEHIHEPWKAPLEVQKEANCIIGKFFDWQPLEQIKSLYYYGLLQAAITLIE